MRRVRFSPDLLSVDRQSHVPLHRQLCANLRKQILNGSLKANTMLPATRVLAEDLAVGRNTVVSAYDALIAEGYLESRSGSGTWVADLPKTTDALRRGNGQVSRSALSKRGERMTQQPRERTRPGQTAFHPGYPEIESFPFSTWARLLKRHARYFSDDIFGYHWVTGHPRLKSAIADHIRATRGVNCSTDQIVVVSGTQAALDILGRLLIDEGDVFWIEEPGYIGAYNALTTAGGKAFPLQVTAQGWQLDREMPPPRLVFVTPSCQWPLGSVMRMEERLRLLQLAEQHNAWILEDDYDSEYRFRGPPIPAMQGLDRFGRVIYLGTFAKTLFPALRIGFVVVPPDLVEGLKRVVSNSGHYPSLLLQASLADFIEEGFLSTHIRRMRRLYAKRQQLFLTLCREHLGKWIHLEEQDAGMQLIGRFHAEWDDQAVREVALRHGIGFSPLSQQYLSDRREHGMILGYAGVNEPAMRAGVAKLQEVFSQI